MQTFKDIPVFLFNGPLEWTNWLNENHDTYKAIWIKIAKKNSVAESITYDEAVSIALCFGWIDGLINKYDDNFYLIRFTLRNKTSVWSKRNRLLAEKLIIKGKMRPSGLTVIKQAKINGSWNNAYDSSREMKIPEDFIKELAKDKKAEKYFLSLNRTNTYAIVWRIQIARKPETRKKRIESILTMLSKGESFH